MKTIFRYFIPLVLLVVTSSGCATSQAVDTGRDQADVRKRIELLLERYAANDQDGVIEMLDPSPWLPFRQLVDRRSRSGLTPPGAKRGGLGT